ncbi:MAG: arylsulfatase [Rhodospirillaceae bacterium]|nr:arylsulfatase [Rhodospirillaceae bacterium]|tara:strand:+ start:1595 stop:3226 length:1632 start_codon:yes stop_codon:yes gene_type:complete
MRQKITIAIIILLIISGCSQNQSQDIVVSEPPSTDNRPNILFIVADDLGYTDIGSFGSEIPTPNLDNLALQGVRLTSLHAARACQETRVMMMASSGVSAALEIRPPQTSGQRSNRLSLNWATLPELLQDAGYKTYMAGKWDLGIEPGYTPATRGFDRSFVQLGASASHFAEHLWGDYSLYELDGQRIDIDDLPEDFYSTNYYTDKILEFIQSNDDSPWFAYVPLTTPHWPLQVPDIWLNRNLGKYDDGYDALRENRMEQAGILGVLPPGLNKDNFQPTASPWAELTPTQQTQFARSQEIYASMIENLDFNIGKLVSYLDLTNQLNKTVIIFTSDHGASVASHGHRAKLPGEGGPQIPSFIDNRFENWGRPNSFVDHGRGFGEAATAPLKGYKGTQNEGGLRAAAFIYYPNELPQGAINNTFITMMDVMPTFLEIANTEHPGATNYKGRQINPIIGRSFWPHLRGDTDVVHLPTDSAGWVQNNRGALIRGNYKIISQANSQLNSETGQWQLYDLESDPGERNNLAQQEPELVSELIDEWETNWR